MTDAMNARSWVTASTLSSAVALAFAIACAGSHDTTQGAVSSPLPSSSASVATLASTSSTSVAASTTSSVAAEPSAAPSASAASEPAPQASPATATCPSEMALAEGEYCTSVRETCAEWMEPPVKGDGRCKRFAPSECSGHRVHKRFCIDKDEYTRNADTLPRTTISWSESKQTCEKIGKRLCAESEWNFACEGPAMLPYPTGLARDSKKCNFDQLKLLDAQQKVRDLRVPSASLSECTSPFGVRNMVGNVDEWTHRDVTSGLNRTALKGGWWMAGRNRCRPATTAHSEIYRDFQVGFRCCADTK
jgi:sulfatase modifying factor 1